jgi:S1-C subfamily serine protease
MNRTLVEVGCGLAALVVMVSFHHQIARLEVKNKDVQELRAMVDEAVSATRDQTEQRQRRLDALASMETKMHDLEEQLGMAAAGSTLASNLQDELRRARSDVELFRSQVATDVERTKQLVDAYINEVRSKERDAAMRMSETQGAIATLAGQMWRDPSELTRTMLLPTVQLNGDDTVGSGSLVWSDTDPQGDSDKVENLVLTSYHVVRNILADTPRARREGFNVTVYLPDERLVVKGRMIASSPRIDAALVRLETDRRMPYVANVLPRNEAPDIKVWDPVCAVGCPLGNDPVPTKGEVSSLLNELNGANYWMINAPTYFGNSGGGVYRADTHQLIGVFSKIYTHGKGTPVVIPHMGLCTPISLVYDWLQEEGYEHMLQSRPVHRIDISELAAPVK